MNTLKFKFLLSLSIFASQFAFGYSDSVENARRLRLAVEVQAPRNGFPLPGEKYILPVSRGFYQQGTQLCWTYAFFNALESNYLFKNPAQKLELSRGAMQRMTLEDRFERWIRSDEKYLSERGDEIDALAIVKQRGLYAYDDYQDIFPSTTSFYQGIEDAVSTATSPVEKMKALAIGVSKRFPELPTLTHMAEQSVAPLTLAQTVLGNETWTTYAPTQGAEGWAQHPDPDARKGTQAYFVSTEKIVVLMKAALKSGHAVAYGANGHSTLIYGAEYDASGLPQLYYIKDSYPNYFYTADPARLHRNMLEATTVAGP